LLSDVPRPKLSIEYRIARAKNIPLTVQGLRGVEEAAALDAIEGIENEEVKYSTVAAELISKSLLTPRGPAFLCAADVMLLTDIEMRALWQKVRESLNIISPTYANANILAWKTYLRDGVSSHGNIVESFKMSAVSAYEYYGIPLRELTDGQIIVFEAAKDYYNEQQG
jgi:hypothetical protein